MAGRSDAIKKVFPKSKVKQTAAERARAATGKRVNRTGGRTSQVSEIAGKSKAELQTIIRVLKSKKDKTASDTAKLDKAEDRLQQLRNKDRAEVSLAGRKMQQGTADKNASSVSLGDALPSRRGTNNPPPDTAPRDMSKAELEAVLKAQEAQARTPKRKMNKGSLVQPKESQSGLKKLPSKVRNKMGYMNRGGLAKSGSTDMRKGGMFY